MPTRLAPRFIIASSSAFGDAHLEHQIAGERGGTIDDLRAGRGVGLVGDARRDAGARLDPHVWPCALSFLAVSGVTATRVSPAAVSRGTPINMFPSPPAGDRRELTRNRAGRVRTSIGAMNERWKPSVTVAAIASRRRAPAAPSTCWSRKKRRKG